MQNKENKRERKRDDDVRQTADCKVSFLFRKDDNTENRACDNAHKRAAHKNEPGFVPCAGCEADRKISDHDKQRDCDAGEHSCADAGHCALYVVQTVFKIDERVFEVSETVDAQVVDGVFVRHTFYLVFLRAVEKVLQNFFAVFHCLFCGRDGAELLFEILFEAVD